jgi:hypothetical protein
MYCGGSQDGTTSISRSTPHSCVFPGVVGAVYRIDLDLAAPSKVSEFRNPSLRLIIFGRLYIVYVHMYFHIALSGRDENDDLAV